MDKKVLIACEESQAVTIEFRKLGIESYSCDLLPCSGGHPEWHLQQDVLPLLDCDWDLIIAFPPCTHLAVSGAAWFKKKRENGQQQEGIDFFMKFANAKCSRIAIENPIGIMSSIWRKPDQIIHPYMFGEKASKATCLWLKGLPKLEPTNIVDKGEFNIHSGKKYNKWLDDTWHLSKEERSKARSKTFHGIAEAMATQWKHFLIVDEQLHSHFPPKTMLTENDRAEC